MSHALCVVALDPSQVEQHGSIEKAVEDQMYPFNEEGDWFKDGSRWDWYEIGGRYSGRLLGHDIIERGELTEAALREYQTARAVEIWGAFQADKRKDDAFIREHVYGLKEADTLDSLTQRFQQTKVSAFAFLRHRRWHENERMGWWGVPAKTECEINHGHVGVCLHKQEDLDAQIISYNHDEDGWSSRYFHRFIEPLTPETVLVAVDYHV